VPEAGRVSDRKVMKPGSELSQPGSIRVKKDQRVHRRDVLGLLGNSGNSDAPHLHFEIPDGPSITQSEGLPYKIASFKVTGSVDKDLNFTPAASVEHQNELPLENVVVTFQ
jgi:murein DD-endopeptidase MepM/ murein hydrolase activator NlpD